MAAVRHEDVLFRSGGACLLANGRPWYRGPYDRNEPDTYTFTRADAATCATFVDRDLTIRKAAAGKLRASWYDTDSDGVADVCGLLLESSRVNICLQSEDFGTTWAAVGTPTRSAGALTCGALSMDLLGDDSGAAIELYRQNVTPTGTAVKAYSVFVSKGSSAPTTGSEVSVYDTVALAYRLRAWITWSGTVPVVAIQGGAGTLLRTVRLASNVYRLEFQTTSCTTAVAHTLEVIPANTAAEQGNIYVNAVQFEDAPYPSSYIKTTTVAVTRAAEQLSFPRGVGLDDMTVYAKIVRPAWADASGALGGLDDLYLFQLAAGPPTFNLVCLDSARTVSCFGRGTAATAAVPAGTTVSLCGQVRNYTTGPQTRLDVGAGAGFGSYSTAGTASTDWGSANTDIYVGRRADTAFSQFNGLVVDLVLARGLFTLAEMQAAVA